MSSNLIETKVDSAGLTQLIQKLGRDCTPNQFVREFIQNGIEAVQRTNTNGNVLVDVNWDIWDKSEVYKICFIDNGDGMTPDEMLKHLNNLSSSGATNVFENYGVGAKIAALTRNHFGILYESWKEGTGYRVFMHYDQNEGKYGVRQLSHPATGELSYFLPLNDEEKPDIIDAHGTRVTLLGMDKNEETMLPPATQKGGRENWLSYYVNARYFTVPPEVEIEVRTGYYRDRANSRHNYNRKIIGQKSTLEKNTQTSGEMRLSDAIVRWYILNPDRQPHGRELLSGHTGCINQNELFDIGEGRASKAPQFGIYIGKENVVLYVEPSPSKFIQNTSRTGLVEKDGSPLPWARWEDEFRDVMPKEIDEYIKQKMGEVSTDSHEEKIRDRLKSIAHFFKISRYRAASAGKILGDPASEVLSSTGHAADDGKGNQNSKRKKGALPGDFEELLMSGVSDKGIAAEPVNPDQFPSLTWVSLEDGSRSQGEIEDRAAQFLVKDNRILANADFQGFKDIIEHFCGIHSGIDGVEVIIKDVVQEVFEQQLIESVTGTLSLKNRPRWKPEEFEKAISEEALTSVVMPRYFLLNHIKRQLGNHFKNIKVPNEGSV